MSGCHRGDGRIGAERTVHDRNGHVKHPGVEQRAEGEEQQAPRRPSRRPTSEAFERRLIALSAAYNLLTENNWRGAGVRPEKLATGLCCFSSSPANLAASNTMIIRWYGRSKWLMPRKAPAVA